MQRITFIGGGNMARSLIGGLLGAGHDASAIHVATPEAAHRESLARDFRVATHTDNAEAITDADIVVLAVKPDIVPPVCRELATRLAGSGVLLISIAAGIRTDQIERWLGNATAIVRVMPNTPALIGAGASALHANRHASAAQRQQAEDILATCGICAWVEDEALMDTVTALSGSGPAYFFLLVEALVDAAVANGLEFETARRLAAQTCLGAGRMMMESGEAPAELRRRVTSPLGTTAAALASFADDGLDAIVARAVAAARARGEELARANDTA